MLPGGGLLGGGVGGCQRPVLDRLMDPDTQLLLAFDFDLDDGAVGQVILEHHINSVAGGEGILNMRDGGRAACMAPIQLEAMR